MNSENEDPSRGHNTSGQVPPQHTQQSISTTAQESIARDLEDSDVAEEAEDATPSSPSTNVTITQHSLGGKNRQPSIVPSGPHPFLGLASSGSELVEPSKEERHTALEEERALLEDNHLISPQHSQRRASHTSHHSTTKQHNSTDGPSPSDPLESTPLLSTLTPSPTDPEALAQKWESALTSASLTTTFSRETRTLFSYAFPLILTFLLQNSLTLTSIFTVGHISPTALGAVSLGTMTANITGYAVFHGLSTSLDTLCAQAYGSGKKTLVGLSLQRMVVFLWVVTVPIGVVWVCAEGILMRIVPEKEIAVLAGRYLRVLVLGAPGYAAFESGKRYVQAQGRFAATLYVLLIAAPLNVFLHWLFVWKLSWGFIGCPIAIVITETLLPLLLAAYVLLHPTSLECWPTPTRAIFHNWGPMIRLALPGLVMVMAEFLAFEILTLAAANFSATHLAANTVLQSLSVFTYNFPFPLAIAGSTRVANLIGAGLPDAAKVTARVMFVGGALIGVANMLALSLGRHWVPTLFTGDQEVIDLAAKILPINAAFQLFDSLAAQCNGVMRGLGKQSVGGIASLVAFYVVALPISFGTGFGLGWELYGLWAGPAIGLCVQAGSEGLFIWRTSWRKASEEAAARNAAG
ncbi:uncharacterized protein LTR77_009276 [Saxophila tyrrhenica]|uniref:Multidrug and toxin extrusion protein n=1 Tax=Saxophila tyrrhenica TaxID=1690608 RepID=A0AAV9NZC4_9PEZI|nr:hypothetical protein LTR77_009276 [Saxophila tyrrhenica]